MILDAPIGTRLIAAGYAPADVVTAPVEDVLALHRADVAAGAEAIFTNTFALPFRAFDVDLAECFSRALAAAHAAHAAHVLVSFGPPAQGSAQRDDQAITRVLTSMLGALKGADVMGVIFETLGTNDGAWLASACARLHAEGVAVGASFVAGAAIPVTLPETLFVLGTNCALFDPNDVASFGGPLATTLQRAKDLGVKSLAKPAPVGASPWLVEALAPFDMVGVCCGGDASHIARLAAARRA